MCAVARDRSPATTLPTIPAFYWDWDLNRDVITWTGGLPAHVDAPADESVKSRLWWEGRVYPGDLPDVCSGLGSLVCGEQLRWEGTYRLVGRDGALVAVVDRASLIEHDGRPHRIVGVLIAADDAASPIPDALRRLRPGERRFEGFVDTQPQLAWEADATGWIGYYNQRCYEYTGRTLRELEGWGWANVLDPADLPRVLRSWRCALQTGQPWEDVLQLRRGADGMLRWHLARAVPVSAEEGRVVRWVGTSTDIHDQHLALEERERLLQDSQATSRAKDEFLAIASHELRTPLSVVLNWAQLLRARSGEPERVQTGLERIERNAHMLARLIEDLLDVSRIINGKLMIAREVVDMHYPVRQALEALRAQADHKHVRIEFTESPDCPPVVGCPQRLQQIVTNLVGNAIKFSEPGHRVEVRLGSDEGVVVLAVRDTGLGIDPSHLALIFERFRQVDRTATRRHGGLGLGLYIVQHLVEAHAGTISAESAGVGRGATFTVRLPARLAVSRPKTPGLGATIAAPVDLAGRKVLIVDDDAQCREVIGLLLARCGAGVTLAGSVAEAIARCREEVPDVVVSDIAMPEVDGFGLLEQLRSRDEPGWREIKVLALTAHASAQDRALAGQAGFDDYLSKPVDIVVLARAIAALTSGAGESGLRQAAE